MGDERLQRALGWGSEGSGLVLLALAGRIGLLLRLRDRSAHMRASGVRDVIIGLGLAIRRDRRPWLWARLVSDALDTARLWKTVWQRPRGAGRRAAVAVGGVGLTLLDGVGLRNGPSLDHGLSVGLEVGGRPGGMMGR